MHAPATTPSPTSPNCQHLPTTVYRTIAAWKPFLHNQPSITTRRTLIYDRPRTRRDQIRSVTRDPLALPNCDQTVYGPPLNTHCTCLDGQQPFALHLT